MKIRIIGGEKVRQPKNADFKQVEANLPGLANIDGLSDADLIVFWLTKSWFPIPDKKAFAQLAKAIPSKMIEPLKNAAEALKLPAGKVMLDEQLKKNTPNCLCPIRGCFSAAMMYKLSVRQILSYYFKNTFLAANKGAAVIVVIPKDFHEWSACRFGILEWLFHDLLVTPICSKAASPVSGTSSHTSALDRAIVLHVDSPYKPVIWPYIFSIDGGHRLRSRGVISFEYLAPYVSGASSEDTISYCPGATDPNGNAMSLVFRHGSGGFLIMPEPKDIQELIHAIASDVEAYTTEKKIRLVFTDKRKKIRGQKILGRLVQLEDKDVFMGNRTFFLLLCFIAGAQRNQGINPIRPKIDGTDLPSSIFTPRKAGSVHKPAQQINDALPIKGWRNNNIIIPDEKKTQGPSIYSLNPLVDVQHISLVLRQKDPALDILRPYLRTLK